MLETIEQCQHPVLAESKVPEIPQPETPSQDEAALTDQIIELWQIHLDFRASIKNETQKFRSLRDELARHLSEMKQVLAKPGRNGQWSSFLKEHKIPRGMADRLVQKYERTLSRHPNCLTEQLAEPTEEEIQKLFAKMFPKLRRILRTPQSVYRFIDLLSLSSDGTCRRLTEEGLLLIKPLPQSESDAQQDQRVETSTGEPLIDSTMSPAQRMVESDGELM
jgi:hypothetical protein